MKLTREEVKKIQPITNKVLIKLDWTYDELLHGRKEKGKFKIEIDLTFNSANNCPRSGTIHALPKKFWMKKGSPNTLKWIPSQDAKIGDRVWFDYFPALRALGKLLKKEMDKGAENPNWFECDGDVYIYLPYHAMFVARRKKKVIPLNGYVLVEPIAKKTIESSVIELIDNKEKEPRMGVVKYMGNCNKRHSMTQHRDVEGFDVGDTIFFGKFENRYMEDDMWSSFDNGEKYYIVERRSVLGVAV